MNRSRFLLVTASFGVIEADSNALAAGTWVTGFEGSSATSGCPLCDSTISFAVWRNTGGNWLSDLNAGVLGGTGGSVITVGAVTGSEQYVYFYQVVNTDPQGGAENNIRDFNVAFADPIGNPGVGAFPFSGGGWVADTAFSTPDAGIGHLDSIPNDQVPGTLAARSPLTVDLNAIEPAGLTLDTLISNPGVNGAQAFRAAIFNWNTPNEITPGATSSVIFLASNEAPGFVWSETESPGGTGAAADVAGVVPEPGMVSLLALGLSGFLARRSRA